MFEALSGGTKDLQCQVFTGKGEVCGQRLKAEHRASGVCGRHKKTWGANAGRVDFKVHNETLSGTAIAELAISLSTDEDDEPLLENLASTIKQYESEVSAKVVDFKSLREKLSRGADKKVSASPSKVSSASSSSSSSSAAAAAVAAAPAPSSPVAMADDRAGGKKRKGKSPS